MYKYAEGEPSTTFPTVVIDNPRIEWRISIEECSPKDLYYPKPG